MVCMVCIAAKDIMTVALCGIPVKGSRLPHKVHLKVVWDLHWSSSAASKLNGNLITIV